MSLQARKRAALARRTVLCCAAVPNPLRRLVGLRRPLPPPPPRGLRRAAAPAGEEEAEEISDLSWSSASLIRQNRCAHTRDVSSASGQTHCTRTPCIQGWRCGDVPRPLRFPSPLATLHRRRPRNRRCRRLCTQPQARQDAELAVNRHSERSGVTKRPAAKGEESRQAYLAARSSCAWSARAGRPGGGGGCAQSRADRCHAAVTCHPQDIPTINNTLLWDRKKRAEKGGVRLLCLLSRLLCLLHLERLIHVRPVRLERVLRLHLDVLLVREVA
eukprot:COSAG04_NODE_61_length_30104_cov_10.610932_1_plen_273_part_00